MAGKTYGIREMKAIVEYLTENKFYGEIKGRKMWMEYANSKLTNRTWQSLKETFLKRILPDIHNPYYKLTIEQINSFRAGYDIVDQSKNKLEIHTVSDDSNGPDHNNTAQASNGNNEMQENDAGEIVKSSKIPLRSISAETVIIDTCYETAEDIKKDLESPKRNNENIENRSLRDCITYLDPLTPMLQEVLDDFQSEPENGPEVSNKESSPQVANANIENIENISNEVSKIVKENQNSKSNHISTDSPIMDSGPVTTVEEESDPKHPEAIKVSQSLIEQEKKVILETKDKKESETLGFDNSKNQVENVKSNNIQEPNKNKIVEGSEKPVVAVSSSGSLNTSDNTPDASLPNNPEALNKKSAIDNQVEETVLTTDKSNSKISRKRLISESTTKENKKTKVEIRKTKANSENESKLTVKTVIKTKAKSVEPIAKQNETQITKQKNQANNTNSSKLEDVIEIPSITITDDNEKPPVVEDIVKVLVTDNTQSNIANKSSELKNPCLQNLSLYDEQVHTLKYNSSESSDIALNTKKNAEDNEIVMLRSHTDSDTDTDERNKLPKQKNPGRAPAKLERDRGLAKVFGFASGAGPSKRRRRLSHRRRTISQNNISQNNAASSEWTSESDSEMYVSPPRGRKNRQTKKYLKPQYARIQSLEEEGGLFVMYGRKIYPLVKDGKLVKHYLTYLPESESEEESYWKLKYVEEKKKAAEFKKLLQEAKSPRAMKSSSPSLQPNRLRTPVPSRDQPQQSLKNDGKEMCLSIHDGKNVEDKTIPPESIKIKFTTKNDQEIHLEGNWPQLQNALEHVVHIFHKPQPTIGDSRPQAIAQAPSSSGIASPVIISSVEEPGADPEIHEKVNKIEDKIFEEIQERDKEDQQEPNEKDNMNVTKRKPGRPSNLSRSTSESPSKRPKISNQQLSNEAQENNINKANDTSTATEIQNAEVSSKKRLRTPQKDHKETNETKQMQTRRSKTKLETSNVGETNDDEEIFYMLPPKNKKQNIKTTDVKTRDKLKKR